MNKGPNPKRMRGRGNGRGGRKHNPRQNVFDSNGPDVRIRGTAQQVLEKYMSLAREASANGDHVAAEGFYQYAEHYYRVHQAMQENAEANRNRRRGRGDDQAEASAERDDDAANRQDRGNGAGGQGNGRNGNSDDKAAAASGDAAAADVTPDGREALRPNGQHAISETAAADVPPADEASAEEKPAAS